MLVQATLLADRERKRKHKETKKEQPPPSGIQTWSLASLLPLIIALSFVAISLTINEERHHIKRSDIYICDPPHRGCEIYSESWNSETCSCASIVTITE
jgi:hypothetical protein